MPATLRPAAHYLSIKTAWSSKGKRALSARGGAIGLRISKAMAKDDPIEVYELEQISELREGKYMGLYNTLAVALKNGEVWSFCSVLPNSSEPKKIIALLKPYMQH